MKTLENYFDDWITVSINLIAWDEALLWCQDNIGFRGVTWFTMNGQTSKIFKFKNEDYAILFILRFGGKID